MKFRFPLMVGAQASKECYFEAMNTISEGVCYEYNYKEIAIVEVCRHRLGVNQLQQMAPPTAKPYVIEYGMAQEEVGHNI